MTPNKFFLITLGLSLIALPFCLFYGQWYNVQPFFTSLFELFCGIFVARLYCCQPPVKRSKFMHLVVGFALAFLVTNLIDGLLYSVVMFVNDGEKDHIIATQIKAMWENYMAFYILFAGIFAIIISTWLMVYVSVGENKFCR